MGRKKKSEQPLLPRRWHPATLSEEQHNFLHSQARINAVVAGRRSFKTEGAKRRLVMAAMQFSRFTDGRFYACAPTHRQAKDIFWEDLKALVPTWILRGADRRRAISDGELTIDLANGARIKVAGLDRPARIEGKDWDGGVISEFGNCRADVFQFHIRPMMTRGGWIDLEGVPEGRNHWYEIAMDVRDSADGNGKYRNAAYHHWTTAEVLHHWLGKEEADAEIAEAKATMDAMVFEQEYEAGFVSFEGRAYYAYTDENLAEGNHRATYDPRQPLVLCFDFNREPGVCLYVQEQPKERFPWLLRPTSRSSTITACIGEVFIKRASNTRKVCQQVINDWADLHDGEVHLYGDPAGGAKTSQGVDGSDWDIIIDSLKPAFGHRLKYYVAKSAPRIRTRVNAVNTRLRTASDEIGLVIDKRACKNTVRDFEGVEADASGDIIKTPGSPLTHITDALGYYIHETFPCGGPVITIRH